MNILYFGTACSETTFMKIVNESKISPSFAPQAVQDLMLRGLTDTSEITIESNTFLPIPPFPQSKKLIWGRRKEIVTEGIETSYLPAINLLVLKQVCYFLSAFVVIISWLMRNRSIKDKVILLYSMYAPVALAIGIASAIFGCKSVVYVGDIPRHMFQYTKEKGIKAWLIPLFCRIAEFSTGLMSAYILVTQHMNAVVNKETKPFIVVEAFVDLPSKGEDMDELEYNDEKAIMYAGTLHKVFGVQNLVDGFMKIKEPSLRLWLFGSGDMEEYIKKAQEADSRVIFFGTQTRNRVLNFERKATLLINPRPSKDEYTKLSFPSKTLEYLASGTPLLNTKLGCFDEDYLNHVFMIENESADGIADAIKTIMHLPEDTLKEKAKKAKEFVVRNKNYHAQSQKIFNFLNELFYE
jgi:glycosyltransferase involved in cell wall biosynthesis